MTANEDEKILDRFQEIQKRFSDRRTVDPKTGRVLYVPKSVIDKEEAKQKELRRKHA